MSSKAATESASKRLQNFADREKGGADPELTVVPAKVILSSRLRLSRTTA